MKIKQSLKISFLIMTILTVILGVFYPIFIFGVGSCLFPKRASGSIIYKDKTKIGSTLIGQNFQKEIYFHPRASYAGNGYDATSSSGSNLGPNSKRLILKLKKRAEKYREENLLESNEKIPSDIVTSSGSGLDPHISLKNALLQSRRISLARGLEEEKIKNLILEYKEGPKWGFLGTKRVNVLLLNLALDKLQSSQ
jgi:potassium-transporting ATPase KdpC subunit